MIGYCHHVFGIKEKVSVVKRMDYDIEVVALTTGSKPILVGISDRAVHMDTAQ